MSQHTRAETIDHIIETLRHCWQANPELRLGQLIVNTRTFTEAKDLRDGKADLFYVSDETMDYGFTEWLTHTAGNADCPACKAR